MIISFPGYLNLHFCTHFMIGTVTSYSDPVIQSKHSDLKDMMKELKTNIPFYSKYWDR